MIVPLNRKLCTECVAAMSTWGLLFCVVRLGIGFSHLFRGGFSVGADP